jgi:hypothetical protein
VNKRDKKKGPMFYKEITPKNTNAPMGVTKEQ